MRDVPAIDTTAICHYLGDFFKLLEADAVRAREALARHLGRSS